MTNVFAYEIASGRLRQVTNVVNGAYQPEPSPDGKSLAYVGYTHDGYDLFVLPLDPERWLDAPPYEDTRPAPPPEPPPVDATVHPYNPLHTLVPRAYSIRTQPGYFGQALAVSASGSDIAGIHSVGVSLLSEWSRPTLEGSLSYTYGRLPFDMSLGLSRQLSPQANYSLGSTPVTWVEDTISGFASLGYSMPRAFDSQSFNLSYSLSVSDGTFPMPASLVNPYNTPSIPNTRGTLGTLHLSWDYSNAQGYLWSVGNEHGFQTGASIDVATPELGSNFTGYAAQTYFATFLLMPWLEHHTLAVHVGAGASGGNRAGQNVFFVGGFTDHSLLDTVQNLYVQGGVQLRGYPPQVEVGNYFGLVNAEYRFPIVNVDRGPSTLPFFLDRISGAAFVDYGSAFDDPATAAFKTGVGGELWFDVTLGYLLNFTFRAGYARGASRATGSPRRTSWRRARSEAAQTWPTPRERGVGWEMRLQDRSRRRRRLAPGVQLAPSAPLMTAQQAAQEFNMDARFGRGEVATERIVPDAREAFAAHHRAWGGTVRLADVELAGARPRGLHDTDIFVRFAWYRVDDEELRTTTLKQAWHEQNGSWQLASEERLDGDIGLIGEHVVYETPGPKEPAVFPTIHLGANTPQ